MQNEGKMYKKSGKYFVGHPRLLKLVTGVAQSDQLVQQRRKVTPDRPIVALTKTCAYCSSNPINQLKLEAMEEELRDLRLVNKMLNNLEKKHTALLDYVNTLPANLRPHRKYPRKKNRSKGGKTTKGQKPNKSVV